MQTHDRGHDERCTGKLRRRHLLLEHERGKSDGDGYLDRDEQRRRGWADESHALEERRDGEHGADESGADVRSSEPKKSAESSA